MNPTEFFVLACDYCNAVNKYKETQDDADKNLMFNLYLKIKATCKQYEEPARKKLADMALHKVAVQELKDKLDLVKQNE